MYIVRKSLRSFCFFPFITAFNQPPALPYPLQTASSHQPRASLSRCDVGFGPPPPSKHGDDRKAAVGPDGRGMELSLLVGDERKGNNLFLSLSLCLLNGCR